jgi:2-succinyl-6-hydroxy-2,4-cyclohexadiene-1-carboxylate synthase
VELNHAHPNLIALHGFLGEAADWKPVFDSLKNPNLKPLALDYTKDEILNPQNVPLSEWGEAFGIWLKEHDHNHPVVLIGYSQGGRLALQALRAQPEMIAGVVMISGNPGFAEGKKIDRDQRRRHDENWAQRFESEEWSKVCADWNAQAVFQGGGREPQRKESPEARLRAAASMRSWSLAEQDDFRVLIQDKAEYLSWVVGERDLKYRGIAGELKTLASALDVQVIPASGHRVLFDNPLDLARLIDRFFEQFSHRFANP